MTLDEFAIDIADRFRPLSLVEVEDFAQYELEQSLGGATVQQVGSGCRHTAFTPTAGAAMPVARNFTEAP